MLWGNSYCSMLGIIYILVATWSADAAPAGFLDWNNLPETGFSCEGKVVGGYYADMITDCQMFHVCTVGLEGEVRDIKFLCLNGTVFDQKTRVCERLDEVECDKAEEYYHLNLELYGSPTSDYNYDYYDTDYDGELNYSSDDIDTTKTIGEAPDGNSLKRASNEKQVHPEGFLEELQASESSGHSEIIKEKERIFDGNHTVPLIPVLDANNKVLASNKTPFLPRIKRSINMGPTSDLWGLMCLGVSSHQFELRMGVCGIHISCHRNADKPVGCMYVRHGMDTLPKDCSKHLPELCIL